MWLFNRRSIRRATAVGLAAAVAVLPSACSANDSQPIDEIRIMLAAPLTGASAESGNDMVNGAKLAAEYLNELGGVTEGPLAGGKFVIVPVDDQESTQTATTLAAQFADDDSLFAMAGFITSGQAQAAGVVAERYHLPIVVSFASASFLTEKSDNLILISASVADYARVSAKFVNDRLGAKAVASISGDYTFLDTYYKGLDEQLAADGARSVSRQTYPADTSDFSSLITNLKSANPEVILSGAFQADAGKLASQVRAAGMEQPFVDFLGEGWGSTFSKSAGSALNQGEYYEMNPANIFPAPGSLTAEISKRFADTYHKRMPTSSMHTFDSVLSIKAMIDAGATTKEAVLDYATKAKGTGVLGPIRFDSELRPEERVATMAKVTGPENGDRELVGTYLMRAGGGITEQ